MKKLSIPIVLAISTLLLPLRSQAVLDPTYPMFYAFSVIVATVVTDSQPILADTMQSNAVGDTKQQIYQYEGYVFDQEGFISRLKNEILRYEVTTVGQSQNTFFHTWLAIDQEDIAQTIADHQTVEDKVLMKLADWLALQRENAIAPQYTITETTYWLADIPFVEVLLNGTPITILQHQTTAR